MANFKNEFELEKDENGNVVRATLKKVTKPLKGETTSSSNQTAE